MRRKPVTRVTKNTRGDVTMRDTALSYKAWRLHSCLAHSSRLATIHLLGILDGERWNAPSKKRILDRSGLGRKVSGETEAPKGLAEDAVPGRSRVCVKDLAYYLSVCDWKRRTKREATKNE